MDNNDLQPGDFYIYDENNAATVVAEGNGVYILLNSQEPFYTVISGTDKMSFPTFEDAVETFADSLDR